MNEAALKRILFVDDEPMVLQGLQRSLRKMRREWEMIFAGSGREALNILETHPVDVIVTDLKMPQIDGAQLLREVKKRHPYVVRIILSGHVQHEMTLQAVQIAHQSLAKPCDIDVLKQTLAKLFALRSILSDASIKKIVSKIESLPSMPAIYSEVMQEMQSEDPSLKKVGDIIARDASMTAKILQVVNSVFFGLSRKISSTQQAVILLGLESIRALVLSVKIFAEFSQKKFSWFSINTLFTHSLQVSKYAQTIVKKEKMPPQTIHFSLMAGLLHDLGKLILATNFQKPYKEVLEQARNSEQNLWELEYEAFGASHAEIGAYLMGLWNLENPIIEAIAFHHCPHKSHDLNPGLLTAVHVGNALAHESQNPDSGQTSLRLDSAYLEGLEATDRLADWRQSCSAIFERNAQ